MRRQVNTANLLAELTIMFQHHKKMPEAAFLRQANLLGVSDNLIVLGVNNPALAQSYKRLRKSIIAELRDCQSYYQDIIVITSGCGARFI